MQDDLDALNRFVTILDWLLALQERHGEEALKLGLIHVCFHDQQKLGEAYGARDAHQMLAQLAARLRETFRRSDLVARDGTDFWILTPYTSPESVTERTAILVEIASKEGLDIVDRDIGLYSLSGTKDLPSSATTSVGAFLAYLKENQKTACHWEHVIQPS